MNIYEGGYVFISYASEKMHYAEATRSLLLSKKIPCWMAPYDIPAGFKYAGVLNDAIEHCSCFLLLLTDEAQYSEYVSREVDIAVSCGKSIVTMQLEEIKLNPDFKFYIRTGQIVPVSHIDENSPAMKKILASLEIFVNSPESASPVPSAENEKEETEDEPAEVSEQDKDAETDGDTPFFFNRLIEDMEDDDEDIAPPVQKKSKKDWILSGCFVALFAWLSMLIDTNNIKLWEIATGFSDLGYNAEAVLSKAVLIFSVVHILLWVIGAFVIVYLLLKKDKAKRIVALVILAVMIVLTIFNINNADVFDSAKKCTPTVQIVYCDQQSYLGVLNDSVPFYDLNFAEVDRFNVEEYIDGEFYYGEYLVLTRNNAEEWERVSAPLNLPDDTYAIYFPYEYLRYAGLWQVA